MRKLARDAGVVAGVAAVTAAAVFAVARPQRVVAEGEAKAAAVERPALKVDGVVLTLVTDKTKYEAGEKPKLTLTAVNANPRPTKVDAVLSMLTTPPASFGGRMLPMPTEAWRHQCALKLAPAETKVVEVTADKALAAGQTATFNIAVGKKTVTAAWLAVPGPGGLTFLAPSSQVPATLAAVLEEAKAQTGEASPAETAGDEAR
ncbi:MAG: hypothetical protein ACYTKD_23340 [Planctomycetota bacterium]|jgi:hypothetical protein